jgi:hypothetical protein
MSGDSHLIETTILSEIVFDGALLNGAHLPPKFGVDVLTIVRNIGFGFACWAYL